MVDTVNIVVRWPLSPAIVAALANAGYYRENGGWNMNVVKGEDVIGVRHETINGWHELLGIVISGKDGVIEWVQASLPRLLHGYNGRLITKPSQLDASLDLLFTHLAGIATPEIKIIEFSRVDLVLNLPGDPRRFVLAHCNARHPWVRSEPIRFGLEGIRFQGKKKVLQLYWKQKERADKSGFKLPPLSNSIRAEIQLKGKDAVREVLGSSPDQPVTSLDFFQCYRSYRAAWCMFDKGPAIFAPTEDCTLLNLIAECEAQRFVTSQGIGAMDWYGLGGNKAATVNRFKGALQNRKQALMEFKWAEMLPPVRLPEPVVDIYRDGREVLLRDLW